MGKVVREGKYMSEICLAVSILNYEKGILDQVVFLFKMI